MTDLSEHKNFINSTYLLAFFYKWRKAIIAVGVLAVISSTTVAFMIPEKYKSTVILFPATSVSISKSLMSQNPSSNADLLHFGEEDDMERMLQVLNSEEIRDRIVKKYKLEEHYGIEKDNKYRKTLLRQEYDDNILFKKTEFMSVKIEVLDRDPQIASYIANDIASLYDSSMVRMKRSRAEDAFRIVEREYKLLQQEIIGKEDSLHKLMLLGVNDYESQAERLNEALGKAIVEGKTAAAAELEQKIKTLSAYGTAYMGLRDNLYRMREQLNILKDKYEEAKVDAQQSISEKFVVDKAFPAEKKSYPVRWIIIVVATLASLIIAVLAIALFENFTTIQNSVNNKENN
ncbi:MAG TPA: Wzz/FepE/Etk N-terminal domain-containing protein [Bacteroidia bacterium]